MDSPTNSADTPSQPHRLSSVLPLISLSGGSHMEDGLLCSPSPWIISFKDPAGGRRESGGHYAPGTRVTSCQCVTHPLYEHQSGMNGLLFPRSVNVLCFKLDGTKERHFYCLFIILIQSVTATLGHHNLPAPN